MKQLEENQKYLWTYYPHNKSGYLVLKNGKIDNTLPLIEGHLMLDRDKDENILGIEFIG